MKTIAFIIGTYLALHGAAQWATDTGEALASHHNSYTYASETNTKGTK